MKKIIMFFLVAFLCNFSYAQFPITQNLGAPKTLVVNKGGFQSDTSFILPTFNDTTTANQSTLVKTYPGNLIRVKDTLYFRNKTATAWVKLATGNVAPDSSLFATHYYVDSSINSIGIPTLQESFDVNPTANPQIDAGYNDLYFQGEQTISLNAGSTIGGQSASVVASTDGSVPVASLYSKEPSGARGTVGTGDGEVAISYRDPSNSGTFLSIQPDRFTIRNNLSGAKVGIGTIAPDSTLDIVGGLKLDMPSKGAGKVLTSDANGAATWETPSSGGITSISQGYGIANSPNPITTTGTISVDTTTSGLSGKYVRISDTANRWINTITRTPGKDSIIFYRDGNRFAIKDSVGTNPAPVGYYGAFEDTITQTAPLANTAYPIKARITDLSNGVFLSDSTRFVFNNTGIYNLQWSGQFQNIDNAIHDARIWVRKNNVDIIGTTGLVSIPSRKNISDFGHTVAGWNFLLDMVAGDTLQFYWSVTNPSISLQYYPIGTVPPSPTTASMVVTITQQSGIMAGTGITAINSLTGAAQTLTTGTSGTDFAISSTGTTHAFNLPTASATNRGALSSADWSTFNGKQDTSTSWKTGGNFNVNAGQFIGSRNNASLRLRTNNTERVVIDSIGSVGIGTSLANASSIVDITSTKGILIPRVSTSTRNAISSPASQLLVSNTDKKTLDQYNGTTWNSIAGDFNKDLLGLQALGSPVKSSPIGAQFMPSSSAALVGSRSYFNAIIIEKEITITGAMWYQSVQGVYIGTGGNYNGIALYSQNNGTLTLIDSTARDTTIWKASSASWNQKAFVGGSRTLQPGVYYLLALANTINGNFTTAPSIGTWQSINLFNSMSTNSAKLFGGIINNVTVPPTSQAMSAWNIFSFYFSLYLY